MKRQPWRFRPVPIGGGAIFILSGLLLAEGNTRPVFVLVGVVLVIGGILTGDIGR